MPIFHKWVNFVVHPSKPGCIYSFEERLDTSSAVDPRSPEYSFGMKAIIFEQGVFSPFDGFSNDELEAMEITRYGAVTIGTMQRVWFVTNEAGRIEKLRYVERHPPSDIKSKD